MDSLGDLGLKRKTFKSWIQITWKDTSMEFGSSLHQMNTVFLFIILLVLYLKSLLMLQELCVKSSKMKYINGGGKLTRLQMFFN